MNTKKNIISQLLTADMLSELSMMDIENRSAGVKGVPGQHGRSSGADYAFNAADTANFQVENSTRDLNWAIGVTRKLEDAVAAARILIDKANRAIDTAYAAADRANTTQVSPKTVYELAKKYYPTLLSEKEWQILIKGPRGNAGRQGIRGKIGKIGFNGGQGPQGRIGNDGIMGPRGRQGRTGPIGCQGEQGDRGPRGYTGTPGSQGDDGIRGVKGDPCTKGCTRPA